MIRPSDISPTSSERFQASPTKRGLLAGLCGIFLLLGGSHPTVMTAAPNVDRRPKRKPEYWIKARFVHQFALGTTWPAKGMPPRGKPFVFAIVGKDRFGKHARQLEKPLHGRKAVVRHVATAQQARDAQVVIIDFEDDADVKSALRYFENRPTLVCGEHKDFVDSGGVFGFRVKKKNGRTRIGYELNLKSAKTRGLKIHAKLVRRASRLIKPKKDEKPR